MGRRGGGRGAGAGGGGLGGCALLAAALVASTLVIQGAGGLKQSHAPSIARKVLLSITNWHPQNYLDDVLHPSRVQDQRPEHLGPAASPETSIHPAKHGKDHGAPVTAPSNVSQHHSIPANNAHGKTHGPPIMAPVKRRHHHLPANNSYVKGPAVSPSKSPIIHRKGHDIAAPPKEHSSCLSPANHRHHKGSPRPAPHKSNNTSAPSHGYPSSPAPAPVSLPPSKGRGQGNSADAPRHPNEYHSPSYSPGHLLLITLPFVLAATNVPAMPPKEQH